ncbi:hypothetical protein CHUAL_000929 [Chamberlinius hualienensis]
MGRIYTTKIAIVCFFLAVIFVAFKSYIERDKRFQPAHGISSKSTPEKGWTIGEGDSVIRRKISYPGANGEIGLQTTWNRLPNNPLLQSGSVPNEQLLQTKKCPVCFGNDICPLISDGALELDIKQMVLSAGKPRKVAFEGAWHATTSVIAKSMVPSEFSILDHHICSNASLKSDCDVAEAAYFLMSNGNNNNEFSVDDLQMIRAAVKKKKSDIPLAICGSSKLVSLLKAAFDEDKDGQMNDKEQIMLYSSVAFSTEVVILKFFSKYLPSLPFPQFYGTCGRIYVMEGGITPLSDFMNEPFNVRASLGAQILQMIEDFTTDEDSDWFIMFTDFSFDNLGVNKDGEVVIIDVEGVILVEKSSLITPENNYMERSSENRSKDPCNDQCLRTFVQQMLHSSDSTKSCSVINRYSHLMYNVVCRKVLSYLTLHQAEDNSDLTIEAVPTRAVIGLLHDPPSKDKAALEELLQECIVETVSGGRTQAAEELRDYLSEFFQDDDDDDYESKNEADEYDVNENGKHAPV